MKIRSNTIREFCMVSVLFLPGCVLLPQSIDNPVPVVISQDQKSLSSVVFKNEPLEIVDKKIETQIVDDAPGKIPAFSTLKTLGVDDLVREVLVRNPTLSAMTAASEAAWSKYPQAISLEDPTLGGWFAQERLDQIKLILH